MGLRLLGAATCLLFVFVNVASADDGYHYQRSSNRLLVKVVALVLVIGIAFVVKLVKGDAPDPPRAPSLDDRKARKTRRPLASKRPLDPNRARRPMSQVRR